MNSSKTDPLQLAARHGVEVIGANQRTIAFTVVADGGTGKIKITAAGHALKQGQTIYMSGGGGVYTGIHRVKRVISSSIFLADGTFSVTDAANINLTASLDGAGFTVEETPLTIAEFTPVNPNTDSAEVIAREYLVGDYIPIPFNRIRITAGNITVIRGQPRASLSYNNR